MNYNGNNTPCGIREVGDPLEGNPNYRAHPYALNGFTYNLQDLVTLPYFGAPISTSVNGWLGFQDTALRFLMEGILYLRPALRSGSFSLGGKSVTAQNDAESSCPLDVTG